MLLFGGKKKMIHPVYKHHAVILCEYFDIAYRFKISVHIVYRYKINMHIVYRFKISIHIVYWFKISIPKQLFNYYVLV